jgi:hypothetical protein
VRFQQKKHYQSRAGELSFCGEVSFTLSCLFYFSASTIDAYIFTALTCIINLEPCAFNADSQHFIPRFNKISLLLWIPLKEGFGVKGGPKTR